MWLGGGCRAHAARVARMEFELSGPRFVPTGESTADEINQRKEKLARLKSQFYSRMDPSGNENLVAAREARKELSDVLKVYKRTWRGWLDNYEQATNVFLLITNVLYLGLTLTALILTFIVVQEHVNDAANNEYSKHRNVTAGTQNVYKPCGMPTPDSMYLLQALGALPFAGYDGAALEPDYQRWMERVDRGLCARIVPDVEDPYFSEEDSDCRSTDYYDYGRDHAEELLALSYIMNDASFEITKDDIENEPASIEEKRALFERRACLVRETEGEHPFYPTGQYDAYGDLKTRVARAYVTAMPAFARWDRERAWCSVADRWKNPFDSDCSHSCHIRNELYAASQDQSLMYDYKAGDVRGGEIPLATTFTKQLYRLLALSLAGYYDRYHNGGACFSNKKNEDALIFCQDSMKEEGSGEQSKVEPGSTSIEKFIQQNTRISEQAQCTRPSRSPPPPAPTFTRNNEKVSELRSAHVCAATLQYGLFEQGRLFGIPDVIEPFVLDQRVDRSLHFIATWVYDAMYVEPLKKAGSILSDPKSRLELYISYRLSSTAIWAMLVVNAAGYMMVRALVPMGVFALKLVGFKSNVAKKLGGDKYEAIVLLRPPVGWPVALAQIVSLIAIYWILWLDPAVQSHYYITPTCEDWHGLGVQVPAGAFDTTWGKRRFGRFGEHIIGTLLILTFVLVLFVQLIGKQFVSDGIKKERDDAATTPQTGTTVRKKNLPLIMIAFVGLPIELVFAAQSIISGDRWYESIRASDYNPALLATFAKDVQMAVWAAFWTSAAISWYRQQWAVDKLDGVLQYAWMAGGALLLWMPVFQSAVLLEKEIDVAFSDGKGSADTDRLIVYIFVYGFSAIGTGILLLQYRRFAQNLPDTSVANVASETVVGAARDAASTSVDDPAVVADPGSESGYAWANSSAVKFDLSSVRIVPARAQAPRPPARKTGAGYAPLIPL